MTVGNAETTYNFFVVKQGRYAMLGLDASEALGLQRREVCAVNASAQYEAIKDFKHVFEGLGCLKRPYRMVLKPEAVPVVQPARRIPLALRQRLQEELQKMKRAGIIKKKTALLIG